MAAHHTSEGYSLASAIGQVKRIEFTELTELERIAEGGFGIIYIVQNIMRGEQLPIQGSESFSIGSREVDQLINEAKALVLKHVNIVMFHAIIFDHRHYGIVLEVVPDGRCHG